METPWEGRVVSAEEFERLQQLYRPLADAVRELIDATVRTEADEATVAAAANAVREVSGSLRPFTEHGWHAVRNAETGRPLAFTNPAAGQRNPIAPPMEVHHRADGHFVSDVTLGAAYEGPPGTVHGGIVALVLDQLLGEAATEGLTLAKFTGTITLRYLRGTPLGPLHAEAWVERIDGHKTYAHGFIGDAQGPTAEAAGVFIMPAWARESQETAG